MTPQEIEKRYKSALRRLTKARNDLDILREEVKVNCHHPEDCRRSYERDADDGYGKWWKTKHVFCKICGKEKITGYGKEVWE